jgi:hypothetical protein
MLGKHTRSHRRRDDNFGVSEVPPSAAQKFYNRLTQGAADECWLWQGATTRDGYGQLWIGPGRLEGAHRLAWVLSHGFIPAGMWVLHQCDRPACCNPKHLFLGNQLANMQDAAAKGRLHVARPSGHKVSTAELAEIDALLASGVLKSHIAKRFSVSLTWISLYARGLRRQYDRPSLERTASGHEPHRGERTCVA